MALFSQPGKWQKLFSLFFRREEKQLLFRAGNFCTAKDKCGGAGKRSSHYKSHQGGKYATPDFTRGRVDDGSLRADHRRLFILCWAARASNVLITPLLLNDRARFAHVNGDEHSLKSARAFRSRCQLHRKRESRRDVNGCDARRIRLRC